MPSSTTYVLFRYPLCLLLVLISLAGIAQESGYDILTKKDGTQLEVLIVEKKTDEILYRKRSDPEGPIYAVMKTDLQSVKYRNGETESFTITIDSFYETKPQAPAAPQRTTVKEAYPPKNEFQRSILALPDRDLSTSFKFYKAQAKSGKLMGIAGSVVQIALNTIGFSMIISNTDSYGYTYNGKDALVNTGAWLVVGGSITGMVLGPVGFTKLVKNNRKAGFIKREMRRRGIQ